MEIELYKQRSMSACLKAAYVLWMSNIKRILKAAWLPMLIYALLAAVATPPLFLADFIDSLGSSPGVLMILNPIVLTFLQLGVAAWFTARIMNLLNGLDKKENLLKSFTFTAFLFCIIVVWEMLLYAIEIFFVSSMYSNGPIPSVDNFPLVLGLIRLGMVLLLCAFLVPMSYVFMKYMFTKGASLRKFLKKYYITGLKHWAFLFGSAFFSLFVLSIIALFISLPGIILTIARTLSEQGEMMGDPSGLPTYFGILTYVTFAVIYFILFFISIWNVFVMYYTYGTIEKQDEEKEKHKV